MNTTLNYLIKRLTLAKCLSGMIFAIPFLVPSYVLDFDPMWAKWIVPIAAWAFAVFSNREPDLIHAFIFALPPLPVLLFLGGFLPNGINPEPHIPLGAIWTVAVLMFSIGYLVYTFFSKTEKGYMDKTSQKGV